MGNFVVSARKYRPTTFDEVVGQDHIAKTLKNALQTDHLAHAFLFTGPRGVGKTTCARILAKIINCETPIHKVEACNQCSSCRAFNDNASFNILELDAASNNSVENIRTLIEQVRFQPQHGKYKVFIIDEVHMLSTAAFNAFLKTLEEPPSYAIFILATTEKHKIIPTILSRCQIFDFRRIQVSDAVLQLEKICEKEGIQAEKEALHTIAQKADGAMRDALSIFDKIASATDHKITYKDVVANLNLLDFEYYFKMTDAFLREDIREALLLLHEVVRMGFDPDHFVGGLADHFRDLMIARMPETLAILDMSEELKTRYYQQASMASMSFLMSGLNVLQQCDTGLPRARNKRLHVELALSKLTFLNRVVHKDVLVTATATGEKKTELAKNITPQSSDNQHLTKKEQSTITERPEAIQAVQSKTEAKTPEIQTTIEQPAVHTGQILFANLDALRETVRESEKIRAAARKEVQKETIGELWHEYAEQCVSKSLQAALNTTILDFEKDMVTIKTPSNLMRDMILQEKGLMDFIREKTGVTELSFHISVDRSLFPAYEEAQPVQPVTQKEKYLVMLEKNAALGSLTKKLGLKLDNEMRGE
jgi:DNA polymerase-3 subunit gamma/tau